MRIRPYLPDKDYKYLSGWIGDEKTHAFWCANLLPYPITQRSFHDLLEKNSIEWADSAYVATENNGQAIQYSILCTSCPLLFSSERAAAISLVSFSLGIVFKILQKSIYQKENFQNHQYLSFVPYCYISHISFRS